MSDQAKDDPQAIEESKLDPHIKRCPKCGGLMFDCVLTGYAWNVEPPDKGMFDGRSSGVRGIGCGVCGYLEIYALLPAALQPKSSY